MPVLGAYLDALPRYKADGKGVMLVKTDDKDVPESEEGYVLEIRKDGAVISSRGDAGLFYGCATLEQLITDSRESGTAIMACLSRNTPYTLNASIAIRPAWVL